MGMDHSYIWWTNVTGPQMFIKSVVSSLGQLQCAIATAQVVPLAK